MNQADLDDTVGGARPRSCRWWCVLASALFVAGVAVFGLAVGGGDVDAALVPPDGAASVVSAVHCSTGGDGVLDLSLVNDSAGSAADFDVPAVGDSGARHLVVAPSSARALTYTGLADGELDVAVTADGAPASVRGLVDCDPPRLVATLRSEVVAGTAPVETPELPRTGGSHGGLLVGGLLVAAGIAASLVARRRYG